MSTVVVIGMPGETGFWLADLGAGTVAKLEGAGSGALAAAEKLRGASAVTSGVDFAVAMRSSESVASGQFDGC